MRFFALALVLIAAADAAAQGFPADPIAEAKAFLELFLAKDARLADRFDATMAKAFTAAQAAASADQLVAAGGKFVAFGAARVEEQGPYLVVITVGTYEKLEFDFRVVFDGEGKVAGFFAQNPRLPTGAWLAPSYADAAKFTEEELTVDAGGWPLPATLTLPKGKGPFPAVVLVHGSGPNDRDETIGPNKVFKDLAWGLASRGVAVLRYEKRTKVHALRLGPLVDSFGVREEVVEDALAALALLSRDARLDAKRLTLVGHSLGAQLAPMIALDAAGRKLPGASALVLLAPPARPLEDLVLEQSRYLAGLEPKLSEEQRGVLAELEKAVARVKELPKGAKYEAAELPLGAPAAYWLSLAGYDPVAAAKATGLPLLVLHGGRDYQVTAADAALWKAGVGSLKAATLKTFPALNHLFIAGKGTPSPAEYSAAGHVDPGVVKAIADFALKAGK